MNKDLRKALEHRFLLDQAADKGWPCLREVLTQIRRPPNKRRLRTLSVTEAAASVDGAYVKLLRARLERASKAAEFALRTCPADRAGHCRLRKMPAAANHRSRCNRCRLICKARPAQ
ncbi:unnamed protein product [Symbiodinium natans]|uniref:Uncharacterized protein n=1 Tax=Symbiodinium natans TaxID=878477 RepID=A0A812V2K4_9DINO|nr:unnamed protein product [Symbiodinium natans]